MIEQSQEQLIDIYDLVYQPFWQSKWFFWSSCFFGAGFIILGCYFLYVWYVKKSNVIDCAILAYQKLEKFEKILVLKEQDSKDYYFSLSSIVKNYLACRYDNSFSCMTDKEMLEKIKKYTNEANVRLLERIVLNMKMVKFEFKMVTENQLKQDIVLIKQFVEDTTLQYQYETKGK
ncbi:MAG: hypothetical protein ACXWL2_02880 [Candidatus Chromulinivorax sp.]